MADSDALDDSSSLSQGIRRNLSDVLDPETVLRGACQQFEESSVDWIAELNLAQATMLGARCDRPM